MRILSLFKANYFEKHKKQNKYLLYTTNTFYITKGEIYVNSYFE